LWLSASPQTVSIDSKGVVTGRSSGQATISASYRGWQDSAQVDVTAKDALLVTATFGQGLFQPGTTVTMSMQGYYSVNSADMGQLGLTIRDQTGTISSTVPLTVAKGGDAFILSATFVVPQNSTHVCRQASLEIGPVTIVEPQSPSGLPWCLTVVRP